VREISCGAFLRSYCTKNTDEVYAFKSRGFGGEVGVGATSIPEPALPTNLRAECN